MAKPRAAELKAELVDALRRHSGVTVLFHAAVAERLGLGAADHKCLDLLMRLGPMTAGELAGHTGLTTGAITGVVDRLERVGYARRAPHPSDRRSVIVEPVQEKALADFGPLFEGIARDTATMLDLYTVEQLTLIADFLVRADELATRHTTALRAK
ncbi:family transcriptional regulator : MarR family transcriptional regulator OS=Brevibacillus panacihumi W25 GN=T458_09110 PE=4 SV=1: MarR [Gemmata massiliana]|uniref:HTH marR-type domain-containing protein n=1 Tax=Gemmata massiliana TaxID=1210884 RepID=A0A6P2CVD3_9BACT|nr:MarR family transcriptional regulator [Gemmata massiliana]VTR91062.1 family transcriptional regulator : MarR family transcriptional regulator OS=Brevibacillus panacihumi W25 GN=T458_09110 PE=4 SV=1: MarR [Gemmata massiliana]